MSTRASIRSRSRIAGQTGAGVDVTGINRNLNTLLQSQLWTETSGGSYADTTAQLYQQLQQIYGTPGSSTSFDAIFNNFTSALQSALDQPEFVFGAERGRQRRARRGAKPQFDDRQHPTAARPGGSGHRQRRANGQYRPAADRPNQPAAAGGARRTAPRRRWRISATRISRSSSQLMNVNVVQGSNNQISVFTGHRPATGRQQPGRRNLSFNDVGTLSATSQWSANPSQDSVGTITLTSPGGTTTDLIADKRHSVGPDRRLPADARQHPAAGAGAARRVGESDVAGVVEPDDVRHGGDVRFAGRL